jgi:GxxExxY protein
VFPLPFFGRRQAVFDQDDYDLMGAAFEVYNELGYGMAEEVYQQSLEVELGLRGIPIQSKRELAMFYKGRRLETCYTPDFFVYGGIVVELKAVADLVSDHEAQLFNYMRIVRQPVGYLINFGQKTGLQWKRFILSDLHRRQTAER